MSEAIDRVLERVAQALEQPYEGRFTTFVRETLERELKPLLEAGQAMRSAYPYTHENATIAWDAALASVERPAERGKGNE